MSKYDRTQPNEVKQVLKVIASVYCKFLKTIDFEDELYLRGINEGKNKFLSNAWLLMWKGGKYDKTQFISKAAKNLLQEKGNDADLVFEHIVPKKAYQQLIEDEAHKMKQNLSPDFIENILNQYWILATVTKDEDSKLDRKVLDLESYSKNPFIRYEQADIKLVRNDLQVNMEILTQHLGKS